jgi:hypothetical protein
MIDKLETMVKEEKNEASIVELNKREPKTLIDHRKLSEQTKEMTHKLSDDVVVKLIKTKPATEKYKDNMKAAAAVNTKLATEKHKDNMKASVVDKTSHQAIYLETSSKEATIKPSNSVLKKISVDNVNELEAKASGSLQSKGSETKSLKEIDIKASNKAADVTDDGTNGYKLSLHKLQSHVPVFLLNSVFLLNLLLFYIQMLLSYF